MFNWRMQQAQEQITLSAYERKVTYEIFYDTMEFLEKYIEVANYYPDWSRRKQFDDNGVKRKIDGPEDAEECFSIVLLGLKNTLKHKPPFMREEIREEFYRWISTTKIDLNNCPERLKCILFGFNEILEDRCEKFDKELKNSKQTLNPNSPEYTKELNQMFVNIQGPLRNERDVAESLAGKNYNEIDVDNKFYGGDACKGKEVLNQIAENTSAYYQQNFTYFPQNEHETMLIDSFR
ncbi:12123_t:CDS:1 [Acaulospora colombiana]|uniref:12123_t:CDS:1 n=1 Tax=Acaulospora colombiana TaxID=27376 RepID=A0ACA9L1N9_9GLOM|nr:12123_t:CDS:1 [Acaulospora colombiana]